MFWMIIIHYSADIINVSSLLLFSCVTPPVEYIQRVFNSENKLQSFRKISLDIINI